MKSVLYITPSPKVKGGISTVIRAYLASTLTKYYNLYFVASHVDGPKWIKLVKALTGLVEALYYLVYINIDIVHVHVGDTLSFKRKFYYIKLASFFSCKLIYHHHGAAFMGQYEILSEKWKNRVKTIFERVDLLICLSNSWRDNIRQIAPNANIAVIPNAVRLPRLNPKKPNSIVQLTFLGLIGQRKGVFDLLKVFNRLIHDGYNLRLSIGGNGDVEGLVNRVKELDLLGSVRYCGWLSDQERDLLLRMTDIFVLPSYAEGMPMSILEAMAYSVPVVSTLVGGIPELVLDGETGFLIRPGDLGALYQKIKLLIQNKDLRKEFGRKGRLLIKSKHNIHVVSQKINTIYNSF